MKQSSPVRTDRRTSQFLLTSRNVYRLTCLWVCAGFLTATTGCQTLNVNRAENRWQPSNDRNWTPDQAILASAEITGTHYILRNIRDCNYVTDKNFVVNHFDREIDLSQIQTVDFIVVPFDPKPFLAHTMLSFGLDDGTYIGVSVEVRKELGETYKLSATFLREYELIYVLAAERDLIRSRSFNNNSEVYLFPTVAQPEQAQQLFADIITRMNGLAQHPEFYHTITNNCTTNLTKHVNKIRPDRIQENAWQVLLPGFSAKYAHEIGLIDNRIPFDDLKSIAYVNDRAARHFDDPDFSQAIRSNRYLIDRAIVAQQRRAPTQQGRSESYLSKQQRGNRRR